MSNLIISNHYRFDSNRTLMKLMSLKSELKFKGYFMEKSKTDGYYFIGKFSKQGFEIEFNWEYLITESADDVIDYLNHIIYIPL